MELERIAASLRDAYRTGRPIAPIRDAVDGGGVEVAYEIQRINNRHWVDSGRRIVGRKIGLTSVAVQQQLGVDQPDFGALFADMCLVDGEEVATGAVLQPKVEAEVALVLGRDLDQPDVTLAELLRAVELVLPAIEVVGSRIDRWDIGIVDTVADNASSGMFVLGTRPVLPRDLELAAVEMAMTVNGAATSTGRGAACLGHPYRAALWLARTVAALGDPLREGDVVMTGALGPMAALEPGASVCAEISGLGTVRTSMADGP